MVDEPAVGDRFPSREATRSTEAEVYRGQIRNSQQNLNRSLAARKFVVVGSVDTLSNALFVATTPDRAAELQSLPGVKGVIEMRALKPRLNAATTLANASIAWAAVSASLVQL